MNNLDYILLKARNIVKEAIVHYIAVLKKEPDEFYDDLEITSCFEQSSCFDEGNCWPCIFSLTEFREGNKEEGCQDASNNWLDKETDYFRTSKHLPIGSIIEIAKEEIIDDTQVTKTYTGYYLGFIEENKHVLGKSRKTTDTFPVWSDDDIIFDMSALINVYKLGTIEGGLE